MRWRRRVRDGGALVVLGPSSERLCACGARGDISEGQSKTASVDAPSSLSVILRQIKPLHS